MTLFWRRWVFMVLGGALFTPYALLAMIGIPLVIPELAQVDDVVLALLVAAVIVTVIGLTSLLPPVRTLEGAVASGLLDDAAADLPVGPARTWSEQFRATSWFYLHTIVGAIVSVLSLLIPAVAISLIVTALTGRSSTIQEIAMIQEIAIDRVWAAPLAVGLLIGLVLLVLATGVAAARTAPHLLGPDPASRLAELEKRTRELTERNRLARELHDSIGHALTVTTLQASAARTVLRTDPDFAERALLAIEQTGRVAGADLDDFLGLLREDATSRSPQHTLQDLTALVAAHRESGLPVRLEVNGEPGQVASVVSREVYRIVQEGLTNVQRHAGLVNTCVRVEIRDEQLTVSVRNPMPEPAEQPSRPARRNGSGGRGLSGLAERVQLLGGTYRAGPEEHGWELSAEVPTGGRR